ncbi:hypothetical protein [uncultured Paludibaculum sp.]|uniref:hypothetical protein n=1 Tax=uncultured Paludibaculum sp. TaxID=1765020 RepID=UPI002AAC2AC8|nr:hypothetical protein [uncultured Paludibaculum sp.]
MDTGFAGGVVVLGWFLFHSWLSGEYWWAKLNVAGALFYGTPVYSMGLSRASFAGGALLLVLYAFLGGLFGLIARPRGFTRNLLLGMLLAMTWHVFANRFVWRRLDSFGPAYFPVLSTLPAHLIFGLSLSRYASRFQRLALTFGDPAWASELWKAIEPPESEDVPSPSTSKVPEPGETSGQPPALEMQDKPPSPEEPASGPVSGGDPQCATDPGSTRLEIGAACETDGGAMVASGVASAPVSFGQPATGPAQPSAAGSDLAPATPSVPPEIPGGVPSPVTPSPGVVAPAAEESNPPPKTDC